MPSTGNTFPGTGENVDRAGLTAWANPGNVTADDASDATCNGAGSDYLVARNFDFSSIPAGATIVGVTVRVEASEHSGGTEALNAQLQDASAALVGSSQQQTLNGTGKTVYTYGGTADTWGASPTVAMVQDVDFGVRLWFTTSHDVRIDFVTVAIEYTTATELATGLASETDTALARVLVKHATTGVAAETDAAQTAALHKLLTTTAAQETDTAVALQFGGDIQLTPGIAPETDTALALVLEKLVATAVASETDVALAISLQRSIASGFASEVDAAIAVAVQKHAAVGLAAEADTALARSLVKHATAGLAAETDAASAPQLSGPVFLQTGMASETDVARAPFWYAPTAMELDSALAQPLQKRAAAGVAVETDAAVAPTMRKLLDAGLSLESDVAFALGLGGPLQLVPGIATETDLALALGFPAELTLQEIINGLIEEYRALLYPRPRESLAHFVLRRAHWQPSQTEWAAIDNEAHRRFEAQG